MDGRWPPKKVVVENGPGVGSSLAKAYIALSAPSPRTMRTSTSRGLRHRLDCRPDRIDGKCGAMHEDGE
ncbi:MAG: hypothetical protein ABI771_10995 [Betaproteobacteria bacterium]